MSHLFSFRTQDIVKNGYNNTLRREFTSNADLKDCEIAVHSIQLYNSAFNISSTEYGNNTFTIEIPTAATVHNINITLQSGYYSYATINQNIQKALVDAGAYLIDADNNNVFYIQITQNDVYYSCQLDVAATPTALPSGWSKPSSGLYSTGGTGLPTTTRVPRLVINNAEFGKVLGFSLGTYPSASSTTSTAILSNIVPQVNPISSYSLRCSLIKNPYSEPSDIITTFSNQGTVSGQLIDYKPNEYLFIPVPNGTYSSITLTIIDQDERFVKFEDTFILIDLIIKSKPL
jgi:hypothetical protein